MLFKIFTVMRFELIKILNKLFSKESLKLQFIFHTGKPNHGLSGSRCTASKFVDSVLFTS